MHASWAVELWTPLLSIVQAGITFVVSSWAKPYGENELATALSLIHI